MGDEGFLHGVQVFGCGQSFDGGNPALPHLHGQYAAGCDNEIVQPDGAGRTCTVITRDLGAREAEGFAQSLGQRRAWLDRQPMGGAVDPEDYGQSTGPKDACRGSLSNALGILTNHCDPLNIHTGRGSRQSNSMTGCI